MSKIITNECNFLIIGALNSAIIQPAWLKKQFPTLIKGDQFKVQVIPGPSITFRYEINGILITLADDRLIFIPKEIDNDVLDFISKISFSIFEKLPHTPVFAAGCNFVYQLEDGESFLISELSAPTNELNIYDGAEPEKVISCQVRQGFSFPDYNLNILYNVSEDSKKIQYNFDYPIKDVNIIKEASDSLKEHFELTLNLNSKLIKGL